MDEHHYLEELKQDMLSNDKTALRNKFEDAYNLLINKSSDFENILGRKFLPGEHEFGIVDNEKFEEICSYYSDVSNKYFYRFGIKPNEYFYKYIFHFLY